MRTLMGLSLLAVGLFSFSLTGCGDPSEAGCRIDGDCRPGRACVERLCVDKVVDGVDSGVTNNGSTNPDGGSLNPDGGGSNLDMGGLDMGGPTPDMGTDPDTGGPPDMGTDPDMGGPNPDMGTPVFGPSMVVIPTSIDFGFVPTNSSIDATIRIANVGDGDLNLSNVGLQSSPSQAFSVSAPATTVAPGETLDVVVTFAPTQGARFANAVTISGDDANNPDALVELLGRGFGTTFQTCMFTSPSQLDFGPVAPGTTATAEVTVGNCTQNGDVTFSAATIVDGGSDFSVTSNASVVLSPGDTETITVTFAPSSLSLVGGTLRVESSALLGNSTDVALSGGGGCAEAVALAELGNVMNDVATSGPIAVVLGGSVELDGSDSTSPSGTKTYAWSVASAPAGSTATLAGPTAATTSFVPDVAGEYTLELEVTDPTSGAPSCGPVELKVAAVASADLIADVTWNADHDVDLHLLRDDGQGNFPAFADLSDDLHYAARWLDWGTAGLLLDDGFHLGDDPDGFGPERAAVLQLEAGRAYRVVAQFARADGFQPATFDVEVSITRSSAGPGMGQRSRTRTFNLAERGVYWTVFEIDGANGQIQFINQVSR